eukprot:jgi/Botrbrau1/17189/Bobra.0157s0079.1
MIRKITGEKKRKKSVNKNTWKDSNVASNSANRLRSFNQASANLHWSFNQIPPQSPRSSNPYTDSLTS